MRKEAGCKLYQLKGSLYGVDNENFSEILLKVPSPSSVFSAY
jgi:hypothetical protein